MAYDPNLENNPTIKHRLFATAAGSNGDQLYSIDLDKIGQTDGIKKIGNTGIGSADVNGLIFDKGILHGFTKTGQELIIDSISGEGFASTDVKNKDRLTGAKFVSTGLTIQGQLTGAAASQDKFNIENEGYLVAKVIPKGEDPEPFRKIHLNLVQSGSGSSKEKWNGGKVWVLAHGWTSDPTKFNDIVAAIQKKIQMITLLQLIGVRRLFLMSLLRLLLRLLRLLRPEKNHQSSHLSLLLVLWGGLKKLLTIPSIN